MPINVVDHVLRGLGQMLGQFKGNPDVEALVKATMAGIQLVEISLHQILTITSIDDSEGAQLDIIGKLIEQPRGTKDDADYRLFLKAKVAALHGRDTDGDALRQGSRGSRPRLYAVMDEIFPAQSGVYPLTAVYPANLRMEVQTPTVSAEGALDIAQVLAVAKAEGVGFFLFTAPSDDAHSFTFDDYWAPGGSEPDKAMADYWSPSVGGDLASALKF